MEFNDQAITGCRMPAYIEEILTHNYCPYFLRMNIVREKDNYRFIYRPGNLTRLPESITDTYSKLVLIRSIADVIIKSESYLIGAENYLIEPELVYVSRSRGYGEVRIMYYPDVKRLGPEIKLMNFAERIRDDSRREERELFDHLRSSIENGDINKAVIFLDKNILRMEGRMIGAAG